MSALAGAGLNPAEHHRGIPLGTERRDDKIFLHFRETPPVVETRSLAAYESLANGSLRPAMTPVERLQDTVEYDRAKSDRGSFRAFTRAGC